MGIQWGGSGGQTFEDLMQEEPRTRNEGVASDRAQGVLYETKPRNGYLRAEGLTRPPGHTVLLEQGPVRDKWSSSTLCTLSNLGYLKKVMRQLEGPRR